MITDVLKRVLENNRNNDSSYSRVLLKDRLQDYILNYIYNDPTYKSLIFTGGTCLRKIYGLARLSEDLDFDYKNTFNIDIFARDVKNYFIEKLQFNKITVKLSGNKKTVFIKFPILFDIGLVKPGTGSDVLFIRCDFSKANGTKNNTEINSISTNDFTFFVLSYNLSTLFTNKIAAFLERQFFKGSEQTVAFKGRDLFDIVWFLEKSKKQNWAFGPNWKDLIKRLKINSKTEIINKITDKVNKIDKKLVYADLAPFMGNTKSAENFKNYFAEIIKKNMPFVS